MGRIKQFVFGAGSVCAATLLTLSNTACVKVGPDFVKPASQVAPNWLESADARLRVGASPHRAWWRVFNDPVLDGLIDRAYRENLTLRIAGVRVFEARAELGIAVGQFFPQTQQASGLLQQSRASDRSQTALLNSGSLVVNQDQLGFLASWELDFWGKFRRNIESARAALNASVADYDNALVSLTADVAATYIAIRTTEKRLEIAETNVKTGQENLRLAEARFTAGTSTELDVEQARTSLKDTESLVPALRTQLKQGKNALCTLLGILPGDLAQVANGPSIIPSPPLTVAVGIPQELLMRRPDVRSALFQAAAQSARIGVAKADLFPALSLYGEFGFLSTDVSDFSLKDIFRWGSRYYTVGPQAQWNLFNYGRITNSVRVQDARFEEALITYQNTVLKAQQEVEDALVAFLRAGEQARYLAESLASAERSLDIAQAQYREGVRDFTAVVIAQQALLREQDNLAVTLGAHSADLVTVYRALGGGWEIREGRDFIPADVEEAMAKRTDWGGLLKFPPSALMTEEQTNERGAIPSAW
ncbi:MAG TPA: efflux transporter outer membrane subunit [Syntrophorhabdaceae bacterium]|nr:efflux transporter outer membrane subunit [Syntrophorhabdaceae bacterium]